MDFTLEKYRQLLHSLQRVGYQSVLRFNGDGEKQVLLRHDVDLKPQNSLRTAQIEAEMGMKAIYYFRAVPESWDEEVIIKICDLGHEAGYHYESLTTCNGDMDLAYQDFCTNLKRLSDLLGQPVTSICMHGSPRSPYDSKDLWKKYDYHSLGIDYEPYLNTDFSQVFYLTDTGRRWDGYKVSVRDKIPGYQEQWIQQGLVFHSTDDIINAIGSKNSQLSTLNSQLMITTHPQRWSNSMCEWTKELLLQNVKNIAKLAINKIK